MPWTSQEPECRELWLRCRIWPTDKRFTRECREKGVSFELDRLEDGTFRGTVGTLFRCDEVFRKPSLQSAMMELRELTESYVSEDL